MRRDRDAAQSSFGEDRTTIGNMPTERPETAEHYVAAPYKPIEHEMLLKSQFMPTLLREIDAGRA